MQMLRYTLANEAAGGDRGKMQTSPPEKRAFYKYASPETALAVLKSRTFRYSSPLLFNDPFDVQAGLHFDFDIETLHKKFLDRIQEFSVAPIEPTLGACRTYQPKTQ